MSVKPRPRTSNKCVHKITKCNENLSLRPASNDEDFVGLQVDFLSSVSDIAYSMTRLDLADTKNSVVVHEPADVERLAGLRTTTREGVLWDVAFAGCHPVERTGASQDLKVGFDVLEGAPRK